MKKNVVKLWLLVVGLGALNACGGGRSDSSASQQDANTSPSTPAPAPAPVTQPAPAPATGTAPTPAPPPPPTPPSAPIEESTGPVSVPYALPAAGRAVNISTNVADSIRPAQISRFNWAYSLFQSFGTGAFVPDFSAAGAFVIAASGGHTAPPNLDAAVFDFSDATWKRVSNSNGIAPRNEDYSVDETTGAPYYELPGATAGQIPAPPHLYALASYIPASHGGGPKGSYLKLGSPAVAIQSRQGGGIHKMDLATGLWTRVTDDTLSFRYDYEASTVLDPETGRYYFIVDQFHGNTSLLYLDLADMRVKQTPQYPYPRQLAERYDAYQTVFLDPVRRLLVAQRPGLPLQGLDLDNIADGWHVLAVSGTQPTAANRWAFYPADGRFYTRTNKSGQTLYRLTAPSDWKTGTWVFDTVTVSGATLPDFTTTAGDMVRHYGTFFYVPALRCFAWISGEDTPVVLLKPPA